MKFPGRISEVAKSLLTGLLVKNPERRLGGGREDAEEVKRHAFYASVNWQEVYDRKVSQCYIIYQLGLGQMVGYLFTILPFIH